MDGWVDGHMDAGEHERVCNYLPAYMVDGPDMYASLLWYIYKYIRQHACMHVLPMYACMYVCMDVLMYVCEHICTCMCACTYISIYTYIHIVRVCVCVCFCWCAWTDTRMLRAGVCYPYKLIHVDRQTSVLRYSSTDENRKLFCKCTFAGIYPE